jgi:hypothetical protein
LRSISAPAHHRRPSEEAIIMENRWLGAGVLVSAAAVAAAIAACSGDAGPAGATGANGADGTNGTNGGNGATGANGTNGSNGATGANGTNGASGEAGAPGPTGPAGDAGATIVISSTAKHGLDISPVAVNLAGMTGDQIELVGEGSYLVNAIASCGDCHNDPVTGAFLGGGVQYSLGGSDFVTSRNLTPDPSGLQLTLDQFITAIRTGEDFRNSPTDGGAAQQLIVMPWSTFRWMSTTDLTAIYSYLRAIPGVANTIGPDSKGNAALAQPVAFSGTYDEGDVARALPAEGNPDLGYVQRGLAVSPVAYDISALAPDQQAEFGRGSYLVNAVGGCNDCHTNPDRSQSTLQINTAQYLIGGRVFAVPPPLQPVFKIVRSMTANLTGTTYGSIATGVITFPLFEGLLTSGMHVEDPKPTPVAWPMPVSHLKNLELDDMVSIYEFLSQVKVTPIGADKMTQPPARYCTQPSDCLSGETCNVATNECIGGQCSTNADCGACQTCSTTCQAPSASSPCLTGGLQ